jgi:hypothetical protein
MILIAATMLDMMPFLMIAKMKPKKKCHLVCDFLLGSCSKRISNVLEIAKEIAGSGMSNKDCTKCPVGFLNTDVWKNKLDNYDDKDYVLNGIEYGWELGRNKEPKMVSTFRNFQSAEDNAASID